MAWTGVYGRVEHKVIVQGCSTSGLIMQRRSTPRLRHSAGHFTNERRRTSQFCVAFLCEQYLQALSMLLQ
jgi:hypothetical protein